MKTCNKKPTKFFTYNQNNSGGSFVFDRKAGITHIVIIEASDCTEANHKAEKIGLYWNGCEDGRDCSCCGDRWTEAWSTDGDFIPSIYGTPIEKYDAWTLWMKPDPEAVVHYANGKVIWITGKTKSP